ncbi:DnaJ-like cysteine-rich domain-containing protein [Nocardia sp. IFM 10818]
MSSPNPEGLIRDGEECERCRGTGAISREGRTCPDCDGQGVIWDDPWAEDADDPDGDAWDRGHDRWAADEMGAL